MNFLNLLLICLISVILFSCEEQAFKEGRIFAGGQYVKAKTLNKGKQIYSEFCMPCHGINGDGKGVASKGMRVPPRNFKLGLIKFGDVVSGELPHDEEIYLTLKHGLNGTAMQPWDLTNGQMHAVWSYIKTFSPKTWVGKDKKLGKKVTLKVDPFGLAHKKSAIKRGREVYHVVANCQSCHRAYVSQKDLATMTKNLTGDDLGEEDNSIYSIKPQDSDHGYMTNPVEFTSDLVRSASKVSNLARRIACGVGGTAMPSWKETISDNDIWAVAYYVKSLMDIRNDIDAKKQLMSKLK